MSESEAETADGNAVDECPAPPVYYKIFSTQKLLPPILPDVPNATAWSASHQYSGTISEQIGNQDFAIVENDDIKVTMQRLDTICSTFIIDICWSIAISYFLVLPTDRALKEIMLAGISVVSDGCSLQGNHQIEVRIAPLTDAILKLQSMLGAYQPHEARELLCVDLEQQVQRLHELKSEMTTLLLSGRQQSTVT